jgi:two-component sensor histidine kinase
MRPIISESFQDAGPILGPQGSRTERDASLELLVEELQHRIRDLLRVVQCFVANTDAGTAHDYRKAIRASIEALSEAYGLIENPRERHISLRMLLERTLAPRSAMPSDQIVLGGPNIFVAPNLALSLHMIFHELATNACKYGALSSASGTVEVRWDIPACFDGRTVAIQWCESGGPEVRKPQRKGFGMRLIAKALSGSQVDMNFAPVGLVCRILLETDPLTVQRETDVEMSGG